MNQVLESVPIHHKIWCLLPIAHILAAPSIPCLLFLFIFVVAFQNTISLCSIGCSGTCPVDQAGLGLTEILCSLQECHQLKRICPMTWVATCGKTLRNLGIESSDSVGLTVSEIVFFFTNSRECILTSHHNTHTIVHFPCLRE